MISAITDGAVAAERQLLRLRHQPGGIAVTLGAPVGLVIIFGYIFGSAITVPGGANYREFLLPGLLATTAANVLPPMIAMSRDNSRGVVDRFRSLPISRVAVPFGQAAAITIYGLISFVLMGLCGLAVGWRIERGAVYALGALALVAGFQFASTWIGMYLGLVLGSEEAAAQASILVFPITGLSNVFVPTSGMPAWLRAIADWNPVSALAAALRQLFGNPTAPTNGTWQLIHPVVASVGWLVLLLVIFVPLCTARYARAALPSCHLPGSGVVAGPGLLDVTEVVLRPGGEGGEHGGEAAGQVGDLVFDARRNSRVEGARDQPVALKLAQALGEHLRGNAADEVPEVAEALPPVHVQLPQDRGGPPAEDDVDGRRDRAGLLRLAGLPCELRHFPSSFL